MTNGWIGYHPERLDQLRVRVNDAVNDLRSLRCDDPVAAGAMQHVDMAALHLETDWLPLIDRIRASSAMAAPFTFAILDEDGLLKTPTRAGPTAADSNDEASAQARAAAEAGLTGMFAGTTRSYEVLDGWTDAAALLNPS